MIESPFNRRQLFLTAISVVLGLSTLRAVAADSGLPVGKKAVSENDPIATALGYKHDIKNADSARFPQLKKPDAKSQKCLTCNFYKPENKGWGSCQLLTGGLVNVNGWCASWIKKA